MAPHPTLPHMNVPVPSASRDDEDILERLEDRSNETAEDFSFRVGLPVRSAGTPERAICTSTITMQEWEGCNLMPHNAELPEGRSCVRRQTQRKPYLSVERPGKNDNYPSSFAASDRFDTCIAFQSLSLAFTRGRSDTPLKLQIMTSREQ